MKVKFTLGIGFANANREDIEDIPDEDLEHCQTDEEREEVIESWLKDWANNYIDMGWEEVE